MRINYKHLLTLFTSYLIILAWSGYVYGRGDMIELLPYAKWLNDSTLYPKDFFIQHITEQSINERISLAYLFSLFGNYMSQVALLLHVIFSLILLEGLYRVAKMFIQSEGMTWISILIPFTLLMNWNLGGNEMYIPLITSSTIAKPMGIWAIYYFLKKEENNRSQWIAFILLSVATFIQPLVALQLFLIFVGVRVFNVILNKKLEIGNFYPALIFIFTGGIWIYFILSHFGVGEIDNDLFFEFIEFRLPHHFLPSYFSKKAAILFFPLFVWSLFFYYKKNRDIFLMFVIIMIGLVGFVIGVEVLEVSTFVSSQWFKTTIWIKSFSVIALLSFLENKIPLLQKNLFQNIIQGGIVAFGIFSVAMILNPISTYKYKPYDFFFLNNKNAELEISEIAKKVTPKDALFIIPASNTFFKTYSERSTYIDYKAVIHRKSVIPIWYDRIQEVYGINIATRKSGQDNVAVANQNFRNLKMEDLKKFKEKGIDYLLTWKEVDLPLESVGENEVYGIYRLE